MPKTVYGGPYAHESAAITKESLKETPDYDSLIADWDTISAGAEAFIIKLTNGIEAPVGEFVNNVVIHEVDPIEEILADKEEETDA